ncbi:MAG: SMC-Scp complex subunit ScpB [Eubacteriales bacterium]|nr:SMC-Scp complex subunit ScpB [Eubacteriales bacterium]
MSDETRTERPLPEGTEGTAEQELPKLDGPEAESIIEAVLFAAGHPLSYTAIGKLFGATPKQAKERIEALSLTFNESHRAVLLLALDDCAQLCTREEYAPYIREALGIRRGGNLSNSSLETLAIVAYNQPVTRVYIDNVRGVDSSYAVSSLLERGLIECVGRLDQPGRPMLLGTTPDFLRCFGLSSIEELPKPEGAEDLPSALVNLTIDDMLKDGTAGESASPVPTEAPGTVAPSGEEAESKEKPPASSAVS